MIRLLAIIILFLESFNFRKKKKFIPTFIKFELEIILNDFENILILISPIPLLFLHNKDPVLIKQK
jgi:hypothetical protein